MENSKNQHFHVFYTQKRKPHIKLSKSFNNIINMCHKYILRYFLNSCKTFKFVRSSCILNSMNSKASRVKRMEKPPLGMQACYHHFPMSTTYQINSSPISPPINPSKSKIVIYVAHACIK
jgi:hypothetical protein